MFWLFAIKRGWLNFLILKNILVLRFLSWQRLRYMSMYLHKHCLKRYPVKHFHHDNHAFVISTKNSNDFKLSNLSEWLYVISSKLQLADNPSTPVSELYGGRFVPGSPETLCLCWFCIQINYRQQNYDSTSWRLRGEYTERQRQRQVSSIRLGRLYTWWRLEIDPPHFQVSGERHNVFQWIQSDTWRCRSVCSYP